MSSPFIKIKGPGGLFSAGEKVKKPNKKKNRRKDPFQKIVLLRVTQRPHLVSSICKRHTKRKKYWKKLKPAVFQGI